MVNENDIENTDLTFIGNDPGAVKFGNFINYYKFHDVKERTNNLNCDMFAKPINDKLVCLDVGCNSGNLTKELYLYLKGMYPECNISILAVDIDPLLIQRAKESNNNSDITFMVANIMWKSDQIHIQKYLNTHEIEKFDITFCFSVTMWIHLNNGDDGLKEFLRFVKIISRTIVIEPQPWNCYRNAQRRVKKSGSNFPFYESLQIRSNVDKVIENVILEDKFTKVYESPSSSWNRKIQSFQECD